VVLSGDGRVHRSRGRRVRRMIERPRLDRGAAILGLLTVVSANFVYLTGLPQILDPMIGMEPFYIQMAQQPLTSIMQQDPTWGPLYAVWLKPFVVALGDPVAVYTANLYGLSLGVSVMLYCYLLLLTRRAAVAVGAALFFLVCDLNVPLLSKVSAFAMMLILAGLSASELVATGARRMSVAAVGVLLASYARPELYPAVALVWLAAVWLAARELGESGWAVVLWPSVALAVIAAAAFSVGTPLSSSSGSGGRLLAAFREHFAWNWSRWHDQPPDLTSVWDHEFGAAPNLLAAYHNNPGAVTHHLTDNLLGTTKFLTTTAFEHYPILAPATIPALVQAEDLLVSAALFGSLVLIVARPGLRRQMFATYGHVLVPYLALATCAIGAGVVVFPLPHYLLVPGVLLMLAGALAVSAIVSAPAAAPRRAGIVAALACLAAIPKPFVLPAAYVVPGSPFKARITVTRTISDTLALVRALQLPAPVHVLSFTDGLGEMLGVGFHEIKIWGKGPQPLAAYLRDNDVGVIVSLGPGQESALDNDPDWKSIQNDPGAVGFARVPVPGHESVGVFVRKNLLHG